MNRRQTLMRAVGRLRRSWNNHVRQITLAEGIPDSYRTVMLFLERHPGASQRNIAEFADVTTSAINQTVKSMLQEDYLQKQTDPTDKRNTKLYLTEKGSGVAARLYEKLSASDDSITAMIGAEKEAEMIEFLNQLSEFIGKDLA